MQVIAKNQTAEIISLYIRAGTSIEVPASGEIDLLTGATRESLTKADDVMYHIKEGNIIINDGAKDLTWIQAFDFIRGYKIQAELPNPTTDTGVLLAAVTKPDYGDVKIFSHNFADPTTWFTESERITELLTARDVDYGSIWYGSHRNWIDLTHGKVMGEDRISSNYVVDAHVYDSYGVRCPDCQEKNPHSGEGNYVVDYASGEIEFDGNVFEHYPDGYVKATYSYANGSVMYVRPTEGKVLSIERSEVQFTTDIVMNDTICFQLWVYAYVLETALGYPIGTLAPYGEKYPYSSATKYKSTGDFVAEANGNYPVCPAFGGSGWRGMTQPIITLPFDYSAVKPLKYSYGAEIRVWLEHDEPMCGGYGTVTFYCNSQDEED
jgi:hypothetical protein